MELNKKQLQILEVAEKMFSENGFDGTSVRHIAKEAKINVAMISYYFGSKEKLLDTLLFHRASDFRIQAAAFLAEDSGYIERLDRLIDLIIRRVHSNRRIYKIIHFESSSGTRTLDFENFIQQKLENYKLFEAFIIKGQEADVFSKKITIPLIFPTIIGTYFNFYYNKSTYKLIYPEYKNDSLDNFVYNVIIPHLQQTIKALLTYEK